MRKTEADAPPSKRGPRGGEFRLEHLANVVKASGVKLTHQRLEG